MYIFSTMAAQPGFAKFNLTEPRESRNNVPWTDEMTIENRDILQSIIFVERKEIKHSSTQKSSTSLKMEGDELGLFCSYRNRAPWKIAHDLLCISKFSKLDVIAKAWPKMGYQYENDPKHKRYNKNADWMSTLTFWIWTLRVVEEKVMLATP